MAGLDDYESHYIGSEDKTADFHVGRIKNPAIEIYKILHTLNPSYMNEIFKESMSVTQQIHSLATRRYNTVWKK